MLLYNCIRNATNVYLTNLAIADIFTLVFSKYKIKDTKQLSEKLSANIKLECETQLNLLSFLYFVSSQLVIISLLLIRIDSLIQLGREKASNELTSKSKWKCRK